MKWSLPDYICNKSLSDGVFPDRVESAVVIPLFKSGHPHEVGHFRHIPLLSVISKLLEKITKKRVMACLFQNKFIFKGQFDFQEGLCTEMALLNFVSNVYSIMNNTRGSKQYELFLDIKKVFDTVMTKHENAGVRCIPHLWFESYLRNRDQYIHIGGVISDRCVIRCRLLQGSVLFFLLCSSTTSLHIIKMVAIFLLPAILP